MANQILFIRWAGVKVGRERQAMQLFQKSIEYYTTLQREKRIENFEPVLLAPHGGDLNGFTIIRGDAKKLAEVRRDDTWRNNVIESDYCLDGFGIIDGYIGDSLMEAFQRWSKHIKE